MYSYAYILFYLCISLTTLTKEKIVNTQVMASTVLNCTELQAFI